MSEQKLIALYSDDEETFTQIKHTPILKEILSLSTFFKDLFADSEIEQYLSSENKESKEKIKLTLFNDSKLNRLESLIDKINWDLNELSHSEQMERLSLLKNFNPKFYFLNSDDDFLDATDEIFTMFPGIRTIYEEYFETDKDSLSEFYFIADYLGIGFLEKLVILKIAEMYKNDKEIGSKCDDSKFKFTIKDLKDKYLSIIKESVSKMDVEDVDKILKEK